ncbi:MAG: hypothetical protein KGY55_04535 [Candidatus Thermoplasmatota archaeon]|nr:hypothetical protein [Candidatus Thermoplasmatota archaeon]
MTDLGDVPEGVDDRWEDEWPGRHVKEGMGWRVSLSILGGVGWLVFLLVWLIFYASDYSGYQNVAIVMLSLLAVAGLLGIPWTIWGWRRKPEEIRMMKTRGFRWRVAFSAVSVPAVFLLLAGWLYLYADGYSIYQNIAVFIIALLIMGGLQGAVWAPWGMRHGR